MTTPHIEMNAILRKGARSYGDKAAFVWQDERVNYGELERRTRGIASGLIDLGLDPGDRVAILGRNRVSFAVALLGVIRSPFIVTPLNWRHSVEQLLRSIDDLEPTVLLFGADFADVAERLVAGSASLAHAFCLDADGAGSVRELMDTERDELVRPERGDVYAIISTGGTEGPSKGVVVNYGNLEGSAINFLAVEGPDHDDIYMVLPQMFHNPHLYLVPYLFVGATIVIPDMPSFQPETVLETIETERVTRTLAVATMVNYLLAAESIGRRDLGSLELIAYGGSPFAVPTLERAMGKFRCGFLQLYGQTETSVLITTLSPADHVRGLRDERYRRLLTSCGNEVPLTEARVVDEDGNDVPPDGETVGEIIARGPSVMDGYWRQPELTRETLRDGWCYTGDLAARDADGYFYIVDRKKDMVISGGENVFPRQVEDAIYAHPAVKEVAVIGVPDETWGEAVTAVVVLQDGERVTESEIIEFCRDRIAGYMKPRSVLFLESLPKNPSGKVLKPELRRRYWKSGRRVGGV